MRQAGAEAELAVYLPPAGAPRGCLPPGGHPLGQRGERRTGGLCGDPRTLQPRPPRLLWVTPAGRMPPLAKRLSRELSVELLPAGAAEAEHLLRVQHWDMLLVDLPAAGGLPQRADDSLPGRMLALPAGEILGHLDLVAGFDGVLVTDRPAPVGPTVLLGARGYFVLPRRLGPGTAAGGGYQHPLHATLRRIASLSERDRVLARYLGCGASNEAIASALGLTLAATKARVRALLRRLCLRNRTHAAVTLTRCAAYLALGWGRERAGGIATGEDLLR